MQCPHTLLQVRDTADAEKKNDHPDVPRGLDCNHFCTKVMKWNAKKKKRMLSINLQFCCQHELLFLKVYSTFFCCSSFLLSGHDITLRQEHCTPKRVLSSEVFWGRKLKSHSLHTRGHIREVLLPPVNRLDDPTHVAYWPKRQLVPMRTHPVVFFAPPSHVLRSGLICYL